jgi:hypothetical protein
MEKMISTTIPPTYTIICTAAINSICNQKYNPAMPMRENSSQMAERNIFLAVIARRPAPRMKAERI